LYLIDQIVAHVRIGTFEVLDGEVFVACLPKKFHQVGLTGTSHGNALALVHVSSLFIGVHECSIETFAREIVVDNGIVVHV
jgi:hypothetical protein